MRRFLYLVGSFLTLLLLAAAGLVLVLTTYSFEIDATSQKARVTSVLHDWTGLDISVTGDLLLKLGPEVGLRAQGVRILSPNLAKAEELLLAETIALEIETLSLLSGHLNLRVLDLTGGQIWIGRDGRGWPNWTVAGKMLSGLGPWIGKELAARGPVKARFDLKGSGHSYELAPFELAIDKGRFDGSLTLDLSSKQPHLDLDLGVDEVDIRPLFSGSKDSVAADVSPERSSDELFSARPLPTAWLDAADLEARIRIRNLVTPYTSGRSLDIDASLRSRRLEVAMKGRAIGDRSITADLKIDGTEKPLRVVLRVKGDKMMLAPLIGTTETRGLIRGDLDGEEFPARVALVGKRLDDHEQRREQLSRQRQNEGCTRRGQMV